MSPANAIWIWAAASPSIASATRIRPSPRRSSSNRNKLIHVSNLYFTEPQGRLAAEIVKRIGAGKVFFSNSGAEANEGLFKVARKFGHDEGRFEILTATNSFHGRTLAGIAATGQDKVKKGFEPMTPGFRHIPFNDLAAARNAISPATVAIMIEGVQGEGGVTPATPEYLLGLATFVRREEAVAVHGWSAVRTLPHGKIPEFPADS